MARSLSLGRLGAKAGDRLFYYSYSANSAREGKLKVGAHVEVEAAAFATERMEVGGGADHSGVVGAERNGRIAQRDASLRQHGAQALRSEERRVGKECR